MGNVSSCDGSQQNRIMANRPYLLSSQPSVFDKTALAQLANPHIARDLTALSVSHGGDTISAAAQAITPLFYENKGSIGTVASVYAGRMEGFLGSVKKYQAALLRYRDAVQNNARSKVAARQQAKLAFDEMQKKFSNEIKTATQKAKINRHPLSNVNRGLNIASRRRNIAKLNVTSQVQVNNIVKFSQHTKVLGNGVAVIDFGSRVGRIHNSYQAGKQWERDLFIESSSFVASAITATAFVKTGLSLIVFATPFGWVGLIVGGLAVAGTATYASLEVNNALKNNAGSWYDSIMQALGMR